MKVLVLWERDSEKDYACNLAKVLGVIGGSLAAEASVDKDGTTVSMTTHGRAVPKVKVEAGRATRSAFPHAQIEPEPEPQPKPVGPPPVTDPSVWLLQAKVSEADQ